MTPGGPGYQPGPPPSEPLLCLPHLPAPRQSAPRHLRWVTSDEHTPGVSRERLRDRCVLLVDQGGFGRHAHQGSFSECRQLRSGTGAPQATLTLTIPCCPRTPGNFLGHPSRGSSVQPSRLLEGGKIALPERGRDGEPAHAPGGGSIWLTLDGSIWATLNWHSVRVPLEDPSISPLK